jgi:hypothetical protein
MPSESCRQQFSGWLLQFWPAGWFSVSQQLFAVLHELSPPTLQMRPGSLHDPPPLPQRPYWSVGLFLKHASNVPDVGCGPPDHPQQSLSTWQSSPTGWHPDGFWQTLNPVAAPVVPQAREQHDCSHGPEEVHATTVPATRQEPMPLTVVGWHVPLSADGEDLVHLPLQHSLLWKQVSFVCRQYEMLDEHVPLLQKPEQHWVLPEQAFPEPRQVVVCGLQRFPWQRPLQQSEFCEQAPAVGLSCTHAVALQVRADPQ